MVARGWCDERQVKECRWPEQTSLWYLLLRLNYFRPFVYICAPWPSMLFRLNWTLKVYKNFIKKPLLIVSKSMWNFSEYSAVCTRFHSCLLLCILNMTWLCAGYCFYFFILVNFFSIITIYGYDFKHFDDTVLFKINWPGKTGADLLVSFFRFLGYNIFTTHINFFSHCLSFKFLHTYEN